jgi:uncharacterized membrane protein (UPF0127 family)
MNKKWWLVLSISILLVLTYPFVFKKNNSEVQINGQTIKVELALNSAQWTKGLMNRTYLAPNTGMLFVFPRADKYPFWTKDTLIPLDIIWINNNQIVDMITLQPQNGTNVPEYTPKLPADYVLEVSAGTAQKYGFYINDKVKIKD